MDGTQRIAVEQSDARSERYEDQEFQSESFAELGRTLTQAIDQARQQASDIIRRAQEHATETVKRTDRRVTEGLRQATAAERRAAAAHDRLISLERRIDLAQAKLSQIRANATEVIRLVTSTESLPADSDMGPSGSVVNRGSADESREQDEAPTDTNPDLDPFAELASLRDAVDATR